MSRTKSHEARLTLADFVAAASPLEAALALQLKAARLTRGLTREHRFAPPRRWRFDFAWPARRVAVEVEGGVHTGGRHTRAAGFAADCEKYNEAALLGWTVLRCTGAQVKSGEALAWVRRALRGDR